MQDMATLPSSNTRARLGVPLGHKDEAEIEPTWTPNNEAQLIPDWETPADDRI